MFTEKQPRGTGRWAFTTVRNYTENDRVLFANNMTLTDAKKCAARHFKGVASVIYVQDQINRRNKMIYKTDTLKESFPAYDVYTREPTGHGFVEITASDRLGLLYDTGGFHFYREYKPGSVVSYALAINRCPIKGLERAKKNGHELYWINPLGAVLPAERRKKEKLIEVHIGMRVIFEGLEATIEGDHNNGLRFKLIESDE